MFSRKRNDVSPAPTSGSSDTEKKRRRRLSKPMTNKSSTNLRLHALQQENKTRDNNTAPAPLSPPYLQPVSHEQRELIKNHIFGSDSDLTATKSLHSEQGAWKGTAVVVQKFEDAHAYSAEQLCVTPTTPTKKPRRPFSAIFSSRMPATNNLKARPQNESRETLDTADGSPTIAGSPFRSKEDISGAPPARAQRRSSFNPGEATRPAESSTAQSPHMGGLAGIGENPVQDYPRRFSFEEEWSPPPRIARTETPSDLECTQLGGLKVGSLHVVNGTASPAPPETPLRSLAVPVSRRDVSSDYGDFENTDLPTISTRLLSEEYLMMHSKSQEQVGRAESPRPHQSVRVATPTELSSSPVALPSLDRFATPKRKPVGSPDRTSMMAIAYMAEMPDSPYSVQRSSSPTGSVIVTPMEADEVEESVFDDESLAPSIYSAADQATIDTWCTSSELGSAREDAFHSTVEFQRQLSPEKLHPSEQHRSDTKYDSGYSSNVSLRDDLSEKVRPASQSTADESLPAQPPASTLQTPRQVSPQLLRPTSILKQSRTTATELPTFNNLHLVTSPALSTSSFLGTDAPKSPKPRKLQKPRQRSYVLPVEQIAVQGAQQGELEAPPVPAGILANLSIRTQQMPELEKTFNSMDHVRNKFSVSDISIEMPEVRFPSPGPVAEESESHQRTLSFRRKSFTARSPTEKQVRQQELSSGISQADAMAIIHGGFGHMVSGLGSSPYDAVPGKRRPGPAANHAAVSRYQTAVAQSRPRSMMDDRTAAELARLRSRAAFEREVWNERRGFNDRGGIPGKNLRPGSMMSDAPPLPTMPARHQTGRRTFHASEPAPRQAPMAYPQTEHRPQQQISDTYEARAPIPPKHSPRPQFIEPAEEVEDLSLAPPPPSHSPRPTTIGSADHLADAWAAQAEAWKSRRLAADMLQQRRSLGDPVSSTSDELPIAPSEPLYPNIPLRQHQGLVDTRTDYWQPPAEHHVPVAWPEDSYNSSARPLPVPSTNSYWAEQVDRPRSRASQISYAGSLAESLHPADLERQEPPPQFGRYSGGLNYGYEKEAGFGGSAGTRSVSGKAAGMHKGVTLRAGYGVDLGDIPIIAGIQRL